MEEKKTKIKKDLFGRARTLKSNSKNRGITLIALVITIIVLLILAAVTVNQITSENGLLAKVGEARNEHIKAEEKEKIIILIQSYLIEKAANNEAITIEQLSSDEMIELANYLFTNGCEYVLLSSREIASIEMDGEAPFHYINVKVKTNSIFEFVINTKLEIEKIIGDGNEETPPVQHVEKVTLTLDPNDGDVSETSVEVERYKKYGILPTPTRTGYTFDGWYTESTNGTQITENTIVEVSESQTLYAHWTANTYRVRFDGNGTVDSETGTSDVTGTMTDQSFTYGTSQNLTSNGFKRNGYDFLGWSLDSSATEEKYKDKQSVNNLATTNNSTIKLYAVWKEIDNTKILFNFASENKYGFTDSVGESQVGSSGLFPTTYQDNNSNRECILEKEFTS